MSRCSGAKVRTGALGLMYEIYIRQRTSKRCPSGMFYQCI